jgi:hypothetical protein
MKFLKASALDEALVLAHQERVNAFIDERVSELKESCPGVPAGVLRNILTARAGGCECRAYLQIVARDAKEVVA